MDTQEAMIVDHFHVCLLNFSSFSFSMEFSKKVAMNTSNVHPVCVNIILH